VKKIIKFFSKIVKVFLDHILVRVYGIEKDGTETPIPWRCF